MVDSTDFQLKKIETQREQDKSYFITNQIKPLMIILGHPFILENKLDEQEI